MTKTKDLPISPFLIDEFKELKPQFFNETDGNSIRCRLVEIEHESQPGTRSKNSIHVELFDRLKIGRLDRSESDHVILGDAEEIEFETGIFLCGRSAKSIKVFHAEDSGTWPSCKKCAKIARRLINKNLKMHLLPKDSWDELQKAQSLLFVLKAAKTLEQNGLNTQLTYPEVLAKCHENSLSLNFGNDWVEIVDVENSYSIKAKNVIEAYTKYLDKS